jgi:hypothetical protein
MRTRQSASHRGECLNKLRRIFHGREPSGQACKLIAIYVLASVLCPRSTCGTSRPI